MALNFLLIGRRERLPWFQELVHAITSLGELHVLSLDEAMLRLADTHYDLVIIDAARVDKVADAAGKVRALQGGIRLLVIYSTVTWRPVHQAIKTVDMDYMSKSMSEGEYLAILKSSLEKTPPV